MQIAIGNGGFAQIGGEAVVLSVLAVYLLIDCIRNGIWDRRLKPNPKTNLVISVVTGLFVGGFWFVLSYRRYHALVGSIATFVLMLLVVGTLTFTLLTATSALYRRRRRQLDDLEEQEEDEL